MLVLLAFAHSVIHKEDSGVTGKFELVDDVCESGFFFCLFVDVFAEEVFGIVVLLFDGKVHDGTDALGDLFFVLEGCFEDLEYGAELIGYFGDGLLEGTRAAFEEEACHLSGVGDFLVVLRLHPACEAFKAAALELVHHREVDEGGFLFVVQLLIDLIDQFLAQFHKCLYFYVKIVSCINAEALRFVGITYDGALMFKGFGASLFVRLVTGM